MYRELICLTICFLVGILLFYFLKKSCGCNVLEGQGDDVFNELELTIYTDDDGNLIGEFISPINWDNGEIISIYNDESEEYTYLDMSGFKQGDTVRYIIPEYQSVTRGRQMQVRPELRGAISGQAHQDLAYQLMASNPRPDRDAQVTFNTDAVVVRFMRGRHHPGDEGQMGHFVDRESIHRGDPGQAEREERARQEVQRSSDFIERGGNPMVADDLHTPYYPHWRLDPDPDTEEPTLLREEINRHECNWLNPGAGAAIAARGAAAGAGRRTGGAAAFVGGGAGGGLRSITAERAGQRSQAEERRRRTIQWLNRLEVRRI